jgi:prepilin-type N-terminal cleavage/methylation domain-containing protein/prepilin-type processing-associated H-X9-DG protein
MRSGKRQHFLLVGFTLIELLVVVAVMAILIGVLMPVLASARRSARMAACASNLRQVGQALELYQAENKQTYPYAAFQHIAAGVNTETSFDDLLHKHLNGGVLSAAESDAGVSPKPNRIWQCPEDDRERWFGNPVRTYVPTNTRIKNVSGSPQPGLTRLFGGFAGSESSTSTAPLLRLSIKTSEIHGPSEFITFAEYPGAGNWQGSSYRSSVSGPDQQGSFMPRGRTLHRTKWNYLFADGHVALFEPGDTPDPQFRAAFQKAMSTMAVSADPQTNVGPIKVPPLVRSSDFSVEYSGTADVWWGGKWSGGIAQSPKGAQLPRLE